MAKGFRTAAQPGRKEQVRSLDVEVKNMAASLRINQMMMQRIMENTQGIQYDLGKALAMVAELQYKLLAVQQVSGLDSAAIQAAADVLRLNDFDETSAAEDIKNNYSTPEAVTEDSIIIITSKAEDPGKSIFRSKIALKDVNVPDLTKGLLGREVGAKVVVKLGDTNHTVELLGIRLPPPPAPVPQASDDGTKAVLDAGSETQVAPVNEATYEVSAPAAN